MYVPHMPLKQINKNLGLKDFTIKKLIIDYQL